MNTLHSSEMAQQKRFEQVSPELLTEFFSEKGVGTVVCPICSSDKIGIPNTNKSGFIGDNEQTTYITPIKIDTDGPPLSFANYEYRAICTNCAYTMRFAVWPILSWVEKKRGLKDKYWDE